MVAFDHVAIWSYLFFFRPLITNSIFSDFPYNYGSIFLLCMSRNISFSSRFSKFLLLIILVNNLLYLYTFGCKIFFSISKFNDVFCIFSFLVPLKLYQFYLTAERISQSFHWSLVLFSVSISLISDLILIISFLLLTLGLVCFCFSRFLIYLVGWVFAKFLALWCVYWFPSSAFFLYLINVFYFFF